MAYLVNGESVVLAGTSSKNLAHGNIISGSLTVTSRHPDGGSNWAYTTPSKTYIENVDYAINYGAGTIVRLSGSSIPDWSAKPLAVAPFTTEKFNNEYLVWIKYQTNDVPYAAPKATNLSRFFAKIKTLSTVNITVLGDSLFTGAEAELYDHVFFFRWRTSIKASYPSLTVTFNQQAIGGTTSDDLSIVANLQSRVINNPDLVLIGYGMNDQLGITADAYEANMRYAIAWIKSNFPNADVLLMSEPLGNYDSPTFDASSQARFFEYRNRLMNISNALTNVGFADATTRWLEYLQRKTYHDMLRNDINHPTSFGHGVMAEALEAYVPSTVIVPPVDPPVVPFDGGGYGLGYGSEYGGGIMSPAELLALYLSKSNREFELEVVIGNASYKGSEVVSFDIEESLIPSEEFVIGSVISSKLTLSLRTSDVVPTNASISPKVRLNGTSGATEWIALGTYFIDSRSYQNNVWAFVCYDKLILSQQLYVSTLVYPATMAEVFAELCGQLGFTADSSITINSSYMIPYKDLDITMHDMLGYIASAHAASIKLAKDTGKISFVKFSANAVKKPVLASDYFTALQTNPLKTYTAICLTYNADEEKLNVGSGGTDCTLNIYNPFMDQTILYNVFVAINGFTYMPFTMEWKGNPTFEIGSPIVVTQRDGTTFSSAILTSKASFKGGLRATVTAPSFSSQRSETDYKGGLKKYVNQQVSKALNPDVPYYGVTIGRANGLQIKRSDGISEATFNSDIINMKRNGISIFDVNDEGWLELTGVIINGGTITWGAGGANLPTPAQLGVLTPAQLTDALTAYVTSGTMTAALLNTLTTGNFSTIITKDYIASMNLIVGNEITMGPDATISWLKVSGAPNTTKIDANGIYTGELTTNQIKVAAGKLGGDNLIRNGNFDFGSDNWHLNAPGGLFPNQTDTYYDGSKALLFVDDVCPTNDSTYGTYNGGIWQAISGLIVGNTYTFSAMILNSAIGGVKCGMSPVATLILMPSASGWKKVTQTFVATSTTHICYFLLARNNNATPSTRAFYVDKIKLEEGSIQTAWTAHSSELAASSVAISDKGVDIVNGALTVTNPMGTVVIDGTSNMHKILVTGFYDLYIGAGATSAFGVWFHDLGYIPAHTAYIQSSSYGEGGALPFTSLANVGGYFVIDGSLELTIDASQCTLQYLRAPGGWHKDYAETVRIKYFLYKEVAF